MTERPILFSGEMVRAILDGRKTQTRRVIKTQSDETRCPYGQPGDTLWVRETWRAIELKDGSDVIEYKADDYRILIDNTQNASELWIKAYRPGDPWRPSIYMPRWASRLTLRVKDVRVERVQEITEADAISEGAQWTDNGPRKWLKQGVPFETADKINGWNEGWSHTGETDKDNCLGSARMSFANLWDSINAKRGYDWDSNPWVWVVSFERIK